MGAGNKNKIIVRGQTIDEDGLLKEFNEVKPQLTSLAQKLSSGEEPLDSTDKATFLFNYYKSQDELSKNSSSLGETPKIQLSGENLTKIDSLYQTASKTLEMEGEYLGSLGPGKTQKEPDYPMDPSKAFLFRSDLQEGFGSYGLSQDFRSLSPQSKNANEFAYERGMAREFAKMLPSSGTDHIGQSESLTNNNLINSQYKEVLNKALEINKKSPEERTDIEKAFLDHATKQIDRAKQYFEDLKSSEKDPSEEKNKKYDKSLENLENIGKALGGETNQSSLLQDNGELETSGNRRAGLNTSGMQAGLGPDEQTVASDATPAGGTPAADQQGKEIDNGLNSWDEGYKLSDGSTSPLPDQVDSKSPYAEINTKEGYVVYERPDSQDQSVPRIVKFEDFPESGIFTYTKPFYDDKGEIVNSGLVTFDKNTGEVKVIDPPAGYDPETGRHIMDPNVDRRDSWWEKLPVIGKTVEGKNAELETAAAEAIAKTEDTIRSSRDEEIATLGYYDPEGNRHRIDGNGDPVVQEKEEGQLIEGGPWVSDTTDYAVIGPPSEADRGKDTNVRTTGQRQQEADRSLTQEYPDVWEQDDYRYSRPTETAQSENIVAPAETETASSLPPIPSDSVKSTIRTPFSGLSDQEFGDLRNNFETSDNRIAASGIMSDVYSDAGKPNPYTDSQEVRDAQSKQEEIMKKYGYGREGLAEGILIFDGDEYRKIQRDLKFEESRRNELKRNSASDDEYANETTNLPDYAKDFKFGNGSPEEPFSNWTDEAIARNFEYDSATKDINLKDDWQKNLKIEGTEFRIKLPPKGMVTDALEKKKIITLKQAMESLDKSKSIKVPNGTKVEEKNKRYTTNENPDKKDPGEIKNLIDPDKFVILSGN